MKAVNMTMKALEDKTKGPYKNECSLVELYVYRFYQSFPPVPEPILAFMMYLHSFDRKSIVEEGVELQDTSSSVRAVKVLDDEREDIIDNVKAEQEKPKIETSSLAETYECDIINPMTPK